jgi:hypothetical protein
MEKNEHTKGSEWSKVFTAVVNEIKKILMLNNQNTGLI